MLRSTAAALLLLALPSMAQAQTPDRQHFPVSRPMAPGAAPMPAPPFSGAVLAGRTLYVSGTTDGGPAAGGPGDKGAAAARRVMENLKRTVESGGGTMNDLVWVQVFATDLGAYQTFNDIYRSYFTGPLPARAFIGTSQLLGGSTFEIMGVAVLPQK